VAFGVKSGAIQLGVDLVASAFDPGTTSGILGGIAGAASGAGIGAFLGNCGLVGGFAAAGAISLPAVTLMAGGAFLLGLAGYGGGRLAHDFLAQAPGLAELIGPASLLVVGVSLMVDGARRIARDVDLSNVAATFKSGALYLATVTAPRLLDSLDSLTRYLANDIGAFLADMAKSKAKVSVTAAATAGGVAAGSAWAAGTVTLFGSKALGGLALSLGLIAAPVWPLVAGGGLALAGAYAVWRFGRKGKDQVKAQTKAIEAFCSNPLALPPPTA
jgi:hypothetical protein